MAKQENKSVTATSRKITVLYHDSSKHFTYKIEKGDSATREIKLFGKSFKGVKSRDVKQDFLPPHLREIFNDLVYAKHKLTKSEIEALPLIKQYRVKVLSKEVEKVLSKWKAEIVSESVDKLLLKLFPNSSLVKHIVNTKVEEKDAIYSNTVDIHSIFSEVEIAEYLSKKGLFPKFK